MIGPVVQWHRGALHPIVRSAVSTYKRDFFQQILSHFSSRNRSAEGIEHHEAFQTDGYQQRENTGDDADCGPDAASARELHTWNPPRHFDTMTTVIDSRFVALLGRMCDAGRRTVTGVASESGGRRARSLPRESASAGDRGAVIRSACFVFARRRLDPHDYYHRTVLLGTLRFRDLFGPPVEMFRFFRGDPIRTGRVMDFGLFPWWTDPTIKGEFLQALTVLTHRLDYALWPD